jgi:hypothetical protein
MYVCLRMETTVTNSLNRSDSAFNYFYIYNLLYKVYVEVSTQCSIFRFLGHEILLTTGLPDNMSLAHSLVRRNFYF